MLCGESKATNNLEKVDSETVTANDPPVLELIVPSVAFTVADSALYKIMDPVATPAVKFKVVDVPNAVAARVGLVAGLMEGFAPENVMDLLPV
ncbi:hypothetical protein AQEC111735_12120 [Aquirufa ecclesiirivi]